MVSTSLMDALRDVHKPPFRGSNTGVYQPSAVVNATPMTPPSGEEAYDPWKLVGWIVAGLLCLFIVFQLLGVSRMYSGGGCQHGGVSARLAAAAAEENPVKVVEGAQSLKQEIERKKAEGATVNVMFMAPWCGHCQRAKPRFAQIAKTHGNKAFYMVDCDAHRDVTGEFGITAFPTFLSINVNGEQRMLQGAPEDLETWFDDDAA